jgi:hypothetical protein
METHQKKKFHKGGIVVKTEHSYMHLVDAELMVREVFRGWVASLFAKTSRGDILKWQGNLPYILMDLRLR